MKRKGAAFSRALIALLVRLSQIETGEIRATTPGIAGDQRPSRNSFMRTDGRHKTKQNIRVEQDHAQSSPRVGAMNSSVVMPAPAGRVSARTGIPAAACQMA
ncbi:hypothetical protein [Sinorhizobium sp. RAC02]|uniref:hypothetical protein n=1 Tax=Sinorhizobium sp. RAC02 TaxID=1842534 RepID=UPI001495E2E0